LEGGGINIVFGPKYRPLLRASSNFYRWVLHLVLWLVGHPIPRRKAVAFCCTPVDFWLQKEHAVPAKMPTGTPNNENRIKNFKNKGKDNEELRRRRNEVSELGNSEHVQILKA
jgi:hypothetical protein